MEKNQNGKWLIAALNELSDNQTPDEIIISSLKSELTQLKEENERFKWLSRAYLILIVVLSLCLTIASIVIITNP